MMRQQLLQELFETWLREQLSQPALSSVQPALSPVPEKSLA